MIAYIKINYLSPDAQIIEPASTRLVKNDWMAYLIGPLRKTVVSASI
jgi:hypothetical protein